jgi:hypothetical protein
LIFNEKFVIIYLENEREVRGMTLLVTNELAYQRILHYLSENQYDFTIEKENNFTYFKIRY